MPLVISIIYGVFVYLGVFGFGIDVWQSYVWAENWPLQTEPIGWYLSTLWVKNTWYVGATLTAAIVSYGVTRLVFILLQGKLPSYYVLIILILIPLTQPILFSATNVLRQGVAMGFYFLALEAFYNEKRLKTIAFSILASLSHNAVILLLLPLIFLCFTELIRYRTYFFSTYFLSTIFLLDFLGQKKSVIQTNASYFFIILMTFTSIIYLIYSKPNPTKKLFIRTGDGRLLIYLAYCLALLCIFFNYPSAMQRFFMFLVIPCAIYMVLLLPVEASLRGIILVMIFSLFAYVTLTSESYATWQEVL